MTGSDPNGDPTATPTSGSTPASAPGSASEQHPSDAIPVPDHGFERLDDVPSRDLADIPAVEVISRAALMLITASAEKLGLAPDGEPNLDLDEARKLITALAGLLAASQDQLGMHRQPLRDALRTLQQAFRETSAYPDEPGQGPGEKYLK